MVFKGFISQLNVYPVKALAGISVDSAQATHLGLAGDREWMLVNPQGRFVTQRLLPRLAAIQPFFNQGQLCLRAAGLADIPLLAPAAAAEPITVQVWGDSCLAQLAREPLNCWLTQAAQSTQPLRLVRLAPNFVRPANHARFGAQNHTQFADAAPYLIAQQASLDALNAALHTAGEAAVDMRRFRANLVVAGGEAFAEHSWPRLRTANGVEFGLKDHCQRCSVITVNPDSGEFSAGAVPFGVLAQLNAMPDNPKAPAFGVNAVLQAGPGEWLRVGDAVWATA